MAAITRQTPDQFLVRFDELSAKGLRRLLGGGARQVDPYLIGRALVQIMKFCSVRSATGRILLWNEYRVVMPAVDFEPLRALQAHLTRDLEQVLAAEARRLDAELVGDLCLHVVVDESRELEPLHAVIRAGFAPNERISSPEAGEMTVRLDSLVLTGELTVPAMPAVGYETVAVADPVEYSPPPCRLAWSSGQAVVPDGVRAILGRPHPNPPEHFVALTGASIRINKQHCWLHVGPSAVLVGRFPAANPVVVAGTMVEASQEVVVAQFPAEIALSRGDLLITLDRG